jgi:hypothetical protein
MANEVCIGHQPRGLAIPDDVFAEPFEMVGAANEVIEAFLLPESTLLAERFIDLAGRVLFPGIALCFNFGRSEEAHEQMDVVGHDDVVAKVVSLSVEV